jgi:hypothetical protein
MPFVSINPTNPKTNLWNFGYNCSAFGGGFFESAILNFFLILIFFFYTWFLFKLVTINGVLRIFQNFDDYPDFQQKARGV